MRCLKQVIKRAGRWQGKWLREDQAHYSSGSCGFLQAYGAPRELDSRATTQLPIA
jgi:hypothetical protein